MKVALTVSALALSLAALGAVVWRAWPALDDAALVGEDLDREDALGAHPRSLSPYDVPSITKLPSCVRGIVPLWTSPVGVGQRRWQHVARLSPGVEYLVANPNSCANCGFDSNQRGAIDMVRAAGVKVLGLVDLWGGSRPLSSAQAEIKQWLGGVLGDPDYEMDADGILFNDIQDVPSNGANLAAVANYVRSFNASGRQRAVVLGVNGFHSTNWALPASGADVLLTMNTLWWMWYPPFFFPATYGEPAWYQSADRNRRGYWFNSGLSGNNIDVIMEYVPQRNAKYITATYGDSRVVPGWTKRLAAYAANSLGC
jgi:hypothetical protein